MVGYDDDPLADYLDVPLTTIRMPLWELGAVAVDALIDQLERRGRPATSSSTRRRSSSCAVDGPPPRPLGHAGRKGGVRIASSEENVCSGEGVSGSR